MQNFCFCQWRNIKSMTYSLNIGTVVQPFHLRQFGLTWKIKRVKERSLGQCCRLSQKSVQFWVRVVSLQYSIYNEKVIIFLYVVVMHIRTLICRGRHRLIIYLWNREFQIGEEEGRFLNLLVHNSWVYLTPVFCLTPPEIKCSSPVQPPFIGCAKQTCYAYLYSVYKTTVEAPNPLGPLEDFHSINITW